ncbi:MAG: HNH endonuclease signature motif containing protein, partial [Actinomycetota bacterium]
PIPVAAARRLARDGVVKAVLDDDADVRAIARVGRTIPAKLRSALEARDATCVVPGCDQAEGLEIDHVIPHSEGGPTRLDNLARLCRWHHSLKTYRGWGLRGRPGAWEWAKVGKPIRPQLN